MRARLVRIGNSRGIRLPKSVIDQVGLEDEVELSVEGERVVISAAKPPRTGWAEAARRLSADAEALLGPATSTRFEKDDWRW